MKQRKAREPTAGLATMRATPAKTRPKWFAFLCDSRESGIAHLLTGRKEGHSLEAKGKKGTYPSRSFSMFGLFVMTRVEP